MESIYTELALYGSKNECARTDNVFSPISEVCDGTVSLTYIGLAHKCIGSILDRQQFHLGDMGVLSL